MVQRILAFADPGTRVVYIPGNHDDLIRDHVGATFVGLEILRSTDHTTRAGDRRWILHGDEYDLAIRHSRVAATIGSTAYETLVEFDLTYKRARRMLGLSPTSLAHAVKMGSKKVATALTNSERTLQREAATRGYDGVVCGHVTFLRSPSRAAQEDRSTTTREIGANRAPSSSKTLTESCGCCATSTGTSAPSPWRAGSTPPTRPPPEARRQSEYDRPNGTAAALSGPRGRRRWT